MRRMPRARSMRSSRRASRCSSKARARWVSSASSPRSKRETGRARDADGALRVPDPLLLGLQRLQLSHDAGDPERVDRARAVARIRAVPDPETVAAADRSADSRSRTELAPAEGRHADDG